MTLVPKHLEKSDRNAVHAESLRLGMDESQKEWSVVASFYSALHLVDGYLLSKNVTVENHGDRKRQMRRRSEISQGRGQAICRNYYWLQDKSEQVRYDAGYALNGDDVAEAKRKLNTLVSFFRPKLQTYTKS